MPAKRQRGQVEREDEESEVLHRAREQLAQHGQILLGRGEVEVRLELVHWCSEPSRCVERAYAWSCEVGDGDEQEDDGEADGA